MEVVSGNAGDAIVVVPYFSGTEVATASAPSVDADALARRGFEGKSSQMALIEGNGSAVLVTGLGDKAELNLDTIRRMGANVARSASKLPEIAVLLPECELAVPDMSQAITEGAQLGTYKFTEYKSESEAPKLQKVTIVDGDNARIDVGNRIAKAVSMARDMVNQPPGAMTPTRIAEIATQVASENNLDIVVWDENDIERERCGGLRGVSMGSDEPPRLIQLTYTPENPTATVALVGKGITFDSGGLSLKPADGMMTMKTDMSGAAAVIAVMSVLPHLAPNVKVIAIACATENLPGPKATKPGDVLRARNGKTMEVLNTDAEGRLVLADGLSLAVEAGVDAIIDIATLTGGQVVALGPDISGVMSNHDGWREQVQKAADRVGEDTWPLPLPKKYRKYIDSEIADIKNIGAPKGAASATMGGLFLQEFVGTTPWVHLDIAGPARAEGDDGYVTKGATGVGIRTLVEAVCSFRAL